MLLQIQFSYSQKTCIWGTGESATLELTFSVDANVNALGFFLKLVLLVACPKYAVHQLEGSRFMLQVWPDFMFLRLTGVFDRTSYIFPGSLPRGLTPITRTEMDREIGGYSRKCAQFLEHERECENRERERENKAREKKSVHHLSLEEEHLNEDGEFVCCLCLWGLVLPSKTKETIQPHASEHLL